MNINIKKDKENFNKIVRKERAGRYREVEKELGLLLKKYSEIPTNNKEALELKAEMLLVDSIIKIYKRKYSESQESAKEAIKIFEKVKNYNRLPYALNRLAEAYRYQGKHEKKVEELVRKAIEIIREQPDKEIRLPGFLRELADVLIKKKKYKEAEEVLKEGIRLTKKNKNYFTEGHLLLTMIDLYLEIANRENLEKVSKILKRAKKLLIEKKLDESLQTKIILLEKEAKINIKKGQMFLKEAEKLAKKKGFKYRLQRIQEFKARVKKRIFYNLSPSL